MNSAHYNLVNDRIVRRLLDIAGVGNVSLEPDTRQKYACDEMPVPEPHLPDVVVTPTSTAAVSEIIRLASEELLPVTPRGAGTGLCGGCVALYGGILLGLEKMGRVLEIDEANMTATVEAGVTLGGLTSALEERGLYYPVYPGETEATIGGNVATNAGGMRAVKYGVTRQHVLGLRAVLASGEVITTGGKYVKSSSGYDLTQVLIGSEGTLAVITEITLRIGLPPGHREVIFLPFNSLAEAIGTVPEILRSGIIPAGIEFLEGGVLKMVEAHTGKEVPMSGYPAYLLVIFEADTPDEAYEQAHRIERLALSRGALEAMVPPSAASRRKLLEMRESFYPTVKRLGPMALADVAVPRSLIAEFVTGVKKLSGAHGVPSVIYGHAGDGNVHIHLLSQGMEQEQWRRALPPLLEEIYVLGKRLGGVLSGEHGVGFEKKAYLAKAMDPVSLRLMRGIKDAFDPLHILNPGKVFE